MTSRSQLKALAIVLSLIVACYQPAIGLVDSSAWRVYDSPLDRYGKIKWADEQARLDNLALSLLRNGDDYRAYVHIQLGPDRSLAQGRRHVSKMLRHMKLRFNSLEVARVSFAIELSDYPETTFFIGPKDARFPSCDSCHVISGGDIKLKP